MIKNNFKQIMKAQWVNSNSVFPKMKPFYFKFHKFNHNFKALKILQNNKEVKWKAINS